MKSSHNFAHVTAYRKSKASDPTHKGFGLMLGCALRDRWITKGTQEVRLDLEGGPQSIQVRLRRGFWNQCPEFMADEVHDWIIAQGLSIPWPKGNSYHFTMERATGTHFIAYRCSEPPNAD